MTRTASLQAAEIEQRITALLERMSLDEKVGQLTLLQAGGGHIPEHLREDVRAGRVGAVLNEVHVDTANELQRIATEESRLGIPLLVGRDVIHGFTTVFPIPLGQAASWDPALVTACARVAAQESAACGVNWTFAPMLDIARDPRWGRIAESLGEDPVLAGQLGAAMVRGFQGDDLAKPGAIAACAKHFAAYGASESGRDYNSTNVPENELRNVYLPPFKAALDAGAASVMTSFSDLDGVPASANTFLLRDILREEWRSDAMVVSDWDSIRQLAVHGFTEDDRSSAFEAARAGVDLEMASTTYRDHLPSLVRDGRLTESRIDALVRNVLRLKFRLGLFESAQTDAARFAPAASPSHLALAYEAAVGSAVLLTNRDWALPLDASTLTSLAVIGPLADDPHEQLGTWVFDGDAQYSRTILDAVRAHVGDRIDVRFARGVANTRSRRTDLIDEAVALAANSEVTVLVLGEEAILSGEAHCRADVTLPGAQQALLEAVAATGTKVIVVLMTGRPLALEAAVPHAHAMLCVWHPGSMAGPAVSDLLFGVRSPSGKLPVTFPRVTGQIPIYYAHKHTGKPVTPESYIHQEDIEPRAHQVSVGNTSFHLDTHYTPLFPFGHGLSYSHVEYEHLWSSSGVLPMEGRLTLGVDVVNVGPRDTVETVQLYVRDLVGDVTRPVRELKAFTRVALARGERRTVEFTITPRDLAFYGRAQRLLVEPGRFHAWIGGSSTAELRTEFTLLDHATSA
ncbi:MAG: glycoside hydrolase family 3 C-terminal domain-containing protein [Gemmatimonadaceae bacterium]|nr:glycoside hydrolase family 3 C-terminal domain-containing protein [Gemmatimonadaceae bacterium]